ncbi:MAG TPA: hypothetical protein VLQ46_14075 [Casimicrobiaceae bacterium]|nr:hypothetical protein [Casimicrobiaceae bacterium]
MAKHVWTVLCRRGVVDQFTNNASIFDVLEDVTVVPKTPIEAHKWTHIPLDSTIVTFVVRSDPNVPEQTRLKITTVAPNGEPYEESPIIPIDLREHLRARQFLQSGSLPFRGVGTYKWIFFLEDSTGAWDQVAEIPLDIKLGADASSEAAKQKPSSKAKA